MNQTQNTIPAFVLDYRKEWEEILRKEAEVLLYYRIHERVTDKLTATPLQRNESDMILYGLQQDYKRMVHCHDDDARYIKEEKRNEYDILLEHLQQVETYLQRYNETFDVDEFLTKHSLLKEAI